MRTRSGQKISLTSYEELLAVPTVDGASDIPLDQLHEFKNHPFHNTLTVYIKRLREKLGDAIHIETVRGMGYRVD